MPIALHAPVVRRYWPLSQVLYALQESPLTKGYKIAVLPLPDTQQKGECYALYIRAVPEDLRLFSEESGQIAEYAEEYCVSFTCVKRRNDEPLEPGTVSPEYLEMFDAITLLLLVDLDVMSIHSTETPSSSAFGESLRMYFSSILETILATSPKWRLMEDAQQRLWHLDLEF